MAGNPLMKRPELPRLLFNETEAARMLGRTARWLYGQRQAGRIAYVLTDGGRPQYAMDDLQAYIAAHRKIASPQEAAK